MQARSVLHLCTEFGADCSIHSKVIEGGPEIRKLSVTPPCLLRGRFMVPMHGGEAPSSMSIPNLKQISLFIQKLLGSQNFEIGSRDPGHAHLGVVLCSIRRRGPSYISIPNVMRIA